jgi:transposase
MLNKLQRSIQNKQRGMLTKGVVFLNDSAQHHTAACSNAVIRLFIWKIFDHPPYGPDLAPINYHLFTKMKVWLTTQSFHTSKEPMDIVNNWLHNLAAPFFDKGLQKLVSWNKCLNVDGNYVEK